MIRRILIWGVAIVVLLAAGAFAITYPKVSALADVGAGYVAHQVCSCVFVADRSDEACRRDVPPDMSSVRSERIERDGRPGVRAWVPLYAERVALYDPGFGCTLY